MIEYSYEQVSSKGVRKLSYKSLIVKKNIVRVILALTILSLALGFSACEYKDRAYDSSWDVGRLTHKINKALEKATTIKKMYIITEVEEGSLYPKDAAPQMLTNFVAKKPKSKENTNLDFSYKAFYKDGTVKEVENVTSYEGLYMNSCYPFMHYNRVNKKSVSSVEVKNLRKGAVAYTVHYKKSHFSRRMEWEYCKIKSDYEYFIIDKHGVIVEYISAAEFKEQDEKTGKWNDRSSYLHVKVGGYELF